MSAVRYNVLLALVGLSRLIELGLSRRNQRRLTRWGVARMREPHFPLMVALHGGVLVGAALEVRLLRRRFRRVLAIPMGILWLLASALRWWVVRAMGTHWNVQVMDSVRLGVVTDGPYRWIRHPNYLAVFVELLALPLLHGAWLTTLVGGLAHSWVLRQRIALEERTLLANPTYRALMGPKPRFVLRIGRWPRS